MSWGYGNCSTRTFSEEMQSNKQLINETSSGTKIYKSIIGKGIFEIVIIWKDNRKTEHTSYIIIQNYNTKECYKIDDLKTQKDIFKFVEDKLKELKLISCF